MVTCEACQRETETVAVRDCAKCGRLISLCWPCSDGKAAGTVQIQHTNCVEDVCDTSVK